MTILQKIIDYKTGEIAGLAKTLKNACPTKSTKDFAKAIGKQNPNDWPQLIAEIKKKSPSRGAIYPNADVIDIAEMYESNGVSAISCLTDYNFFDGSLSDLFNVSQTVEIPVLRKDFIFTQLQITEARMSGADAILLMVSVVRDEAVLRDLIDYAQSLGMDVLVETHDEPEIEIAQKSGASIIGVNARDFGDLSVNQDIFQQRRSLIDADKICVAESGFDSVAAIERVKLDYDAILVGSYFMQLQDVDLMREMVREFVG